MSLLKSVPIKNQKEEKRQMSEKNILLMFFSYLFIINVDIVNVESNPKIK